MRRKTSFIFFLALLASSFVLALTAAHLPERWVQGSKSDYEKGYAFGTAIADDGSIILAPAINSVFSSSTPHLWSLVQNRRGEIFAAGGANGVILDQRGNPLHSDEKAEIYALAVAPNGTLYFASSTGGSIYRIAGTTTAEEFFTPRLSLNNTENQSPPERYIWDIAFDSRGNLYAATGLEGRIYKVTPEGSGLIVYDSEEAHITCLAVAADDSLYFGSDPGGQIFKMTSDGKVSVLYDSDFKEISDIVLTSNGSVYASAVSETALEMNDTGNGDDGDEALLTRTGSIARGGIEDADSGDAVSVVFHIAPDMTVEQVWSSTREVVYAMTKGRTDSEILAGTGPTGSIYRINPTGNNQLLHSFRDKQITALLNNGTLIYAATSNLGELYTLSTNYSATGNFISQVKDAGAVSKYGAISWRGEGNTIELHTRTGNTKTPDNTWSNWSAPLQEGSTHVVTSPAARYIQWRATLSTTKPGSTPVLKSVSIHFLQNNLRPLIKKLAVLPIGITFKDGLEDQDAKEIPEDIVRELESHNINAAPMSSRGKTVFNRPIRTIAWSARDSNGDSLRYHLYIRNIEESDFVPLALNLEERWYSFDSRQFAPGEYIVRLVADDGLSNTPDRTKKHMLDSRPFIIDNMPPVIENLTASANGKQINFSFSTTDSTSPIRLARYKLNDGPWMPLLPTDGIADEKKEEYSSSASVYESGIYLLSVQVADEVYVIGASSTRITVN